MKSIHQKIYETIKLPENEALSIVGGGEILQKRRRMNKFLESNEWNEDKFKQWVREVWNPSTAVPCSEKPKYKKNPALPSKMTMARSLAQASQLAISSGFKVVSEEEQNRRHTICKTECEHYREVDDRCAQCGCFTSYKSRLEAWHCPIGKW